ncbi:MAG TPA: hypothetical protein VML95_03550 [Longimicrobiales bacterium]|nr:hypothetical protein [Longimicrobiales bacterium]
MSALDRHLAGPVVTSVLIAACAAWPLAAQAPKPQLAGQRSEEPDTSPPAAAQAFHMVRGFVTTADRRPARGLLARVKTSAGEQASQVNADGSFLVIAPAGEGRVEVVIDALDPAKRWYFPAWVSIRESQLRREQGFVLVPRAWQIPSGKYAEDWVEVDLDKAFEWVSPTIGHAFYMWQIDGSIDATNRDRPRSWGLESLPISVAFNHDSSQARIEGVDSAGFWKVMGVLEDAFGLDMFRPARYEDASEDGAPREGSMLVWVFEEMEGNIIGIGSPDIDESRVLRSTIRIRRRRWLRDQYLVGHEVMHALGFGHTCAWPTTVPGPPCRGTIALDVPSLFDVAHVQLSLNVNALQRRTGARNGIVAAWNGQKRVMNVALTDAGN